MLNLLHSIHSFPCMAIYLCETRQDMEELYLSFVPLVQPRVTLLVRIAHQMEEEPSMRVFLICSCPTTCFLTTLLLEVRAGLFIYMKPLLIWIQISSLRIQHHFHPCEYFSFAAVQQHVL
jgi:hypothetical protein